MQIFIVTSVRDRAGDFFMRPFYSRSQSEAVRAFTDEINSKREDSMLAKHPEDYDLYLLGTFDDSTGTFTTSSPRQLAVGKEVVLKQG